MVFRSILITKRWWDGGGWIPAALGGQSNWKIAAENLGGDPYHVATTHKSTVELGISPQDPLYASYGHQVQLNHGHAINVSSSENGLNVPPYQGLPEEMWPMFEKNLTKEQLEVYKETVVIVGTVSKPSIPLPGTWKRRAFA